MPTTITRSLVLGILLSAAGCGGGAPPPQVPAAPQPPPSPYPPLKCNDGGKFAEREIPEGVEQVCEINGVKDGPFRRWYSPDVRAVDGKYKMGVTDDNWVWWYEDGTKRAKGAYKDGKQAGAWTWWHQNGNKSEEGDFLSGRKQGVWTRWYDSGLKADEGLYHNGVKDAQWLYFRNDPENTMRRKEMWGGGALQATVYFDPTGKEIKEPLPGDEDTPVAADPNAAPEAAPAPAPAGG